MSRYRNSFITAFLVILWGCSLISFDNLSVTVWPHNRDAILEAGASPWVEFPDSPDRPSVQRLFSLSAPDGQVSGNFRWEGRRMYFDPAPAFRPGVRHVLPFRGRVTLENGQAFDANEEVPFYVGHRGPGPALVSANPADGAIIGISQALVLRFSSAIDSNSFSREFDLQPSVEVTVAWDSLKQLAAVSPKDAWTNLATYAWTVGKDLAAPDGTPTGIEYSGEFRVQEDSTAPSVSSIAPALRETFVSTGSDLGQAGADDVLLLTFSEDVRQETVVSAFSLSPATLGSWLRVRPAVFAFMPQSRWVMSQPYTLRIAATVEDLAGNKLAFPYEASFTPNIPVQTVQAIKAVYSSSEDEWTVFNRLDAKSVAVDVDGNLRLVIRFSQPYPPENGAKLASALLLDAYFPSSLGDPSLVTALWTGGTTLSLTYAGLEKSTAECGKFYKLTLPGGSASSDNGSGSFLKEDVWLYFITNQ